MDQNERYPMELQDRPEVEHEIHTGGYRTNTFLKYGVGCLLLALLISLTFSIVSLTMVVQVSEDQHEMKESALNVDNEKFCGKNPTLPKAGKFSTDQHCDDKKSEWCRFTCPSDAEHMEPSGVFHCENGEWDNQYCYCTAAGLEKVLNENDIEGVNPAACDHTYLNEKCLDWSCHYGYTRIEGADLTCEEYGWTFNTDELCEETQEDGVCPIPDFLSYVKFSLGIGSCDINMDSVCRYEWICQNGLVPVGEIICGESGWSGDGICACDSNDLTDFGPQFCPRIVGVGGACVVDCGDGNCVDEEMNCVAYCTSTGWWIPCDSAAPGALTACLSSDLDNFGPVNCPEAVLVGQTCAVSCEGDKFNCPTGGGTPCAASCTVGGWQIPCVCNEDTLPSKVAGAVNQTGECTVGNICDVACLDTLEISHEVICDPLKGYSGSCGCKPINLTKHDELAEFFVPNSCSEKYAVGDICSDYCPNGLLSEQIYCTLSGWQLNYDKFTTATSILDLIASQLGDGQAGDNALISIFFETGIMPCACNRNDICRNYVTDGCQESQLIGAVPVGEIDFGTVCGVLDGDCSCQCNTNFSNSFICINTTLAVLDAENLDSFGDFNDLTARTDCRCGCSIQSACQTIREISGASSAPPRTLCTVPSINAVDDILTDINGTCEVPSSSCIFAPCNEPYYVYSNGSLLCGEKTNFVCDVPDGCYCGCTLDQPIVENSVCNVLGGEGAFEAKCNVTVPDPAGLPFRIGENNCQNTTDNNGVTTITCDGLTAEYQCNMNFTDLAGNITCNVPAVDFEDSAFAPYGCINPEYDDICGCACSVDVCGAVALSNSTCTVTDVFSNQNITVCVGQAIDCSFDDTKPFVDIFDVCGGFYDPDTLPFTMGCTSAGDTTCSAFRGSCTCTSV